MGSGILINSFMRINEITSKARRMVTIMTSVGKMPAYDDHSPLSFEDYYDWTMSNDKSNPKPNIVSQRYGMYMADFRQYVGESQVITEASGAIIIALLRSLVAKIGIRAVAGWLIRWLFTSAAGLTLMALLTVVQLILGVIVQAITGVSSSLLETAYKQIKKALDDEGEDGEKLMSDLEAELRQELGDIDPEDEADIDNVDEIDPKELVVIAKQELGSELDDRMAPEQQ